MQIHLIIYFNQYHSFHKDLKKIIDQVDELSYNLPKSINIKISGHSIKFIEKLSKAFDKTITSFDEITCRGSVRNLFFLSHIAKKLDIENSNFNEETNSLE